MARKKRSSFGLILERFSRKVTEATGTSTAFVIALLVIVVWILSGPLFRFSDTWQLVINTGTTIVTFLMVFLVQRTQNRDGLAIQLKLNELVAAIEGASNRLIDVEDLTEKELQILHAHYRRLVERSRDDEDITASRSIEEAEQRHRVKHPKSKRTQKDDGPKKRATSSSV